MNWTWSPQKAWEPTKGRYEGKVNMHLPEAWGFLLFADDEGEQQDDDAKDGGAADAVIRGKEVVQKKVTSCPASWRVRLGAASVYYSMRAFRAEHGHLARSNPRNLRHAADAWCQAGLLPRGIREGARED